MRLDIPTLSDWQTVGTLESNKATNLLHQGAIQPSLHFGDQGTFNRALHQATMDVAATTPAAARDATSSSWKGVEACYKALHYPYVIYGSHVENFPVSNSLELNPKRVRWDDHRGYASISSRFMCNQTA